MTADFSRDTLRRRKKAGYAAVCAIGFDADHGVFRVGAAEDVEVLLSRLQLGTWRELRFERIVWTPGLAVARTIAAGAEKFLTDTGHHLGNHWFQARVDVLDDLIVAEAVKLKSPTWTSAELVTRLKRDADREADRFASGRF